MDLSNNQTIPDKQISNLNNINFKEVKANDIIYFKIVSSIEEFDDYIVNKNLSNTFNPTYTNQIFEDEKIKGFVELQILVALSPVTWSPYFYISYSHKFQQSDNIEKLLSEFLGNEYYCKCRETFLNILNEEINFKKEFFGNLEKIQLNENTIFTPILTREKFHINFQRLVTFFINGASEIPLVYNHWNYYILFEDSKTVGFCSVARFHMSLNTYRSMISQFFIFPCFQRKGYGFNLLDTVYKAEKNLSECVDISTEDPGEEYIFLRDVVLLKNCIYYFKEKYLHFKKKNLTLLSCEDDFDILTLTDEECLKLIKKWKLTFQLIKRIEIFVKFCLSNDTQNDLLFQDINMFLVTINKDVFTQQKDTTSFIFYDEDELIKSEEINDFEKMAEELQKYSDHLYKDFSKIKVRGLKIILEK